MLAVVNDSPDSLVVAASFPAEVGIRVERSQRLVPTKIVWESVDVALPDDEATPVSLTTAFDLASQGVARFHGVLRPAESGIFSPGDYTVSFNVRRSVAGVRDGAGKPWPGHYGEEGSMSVHVIEPHTPDEIRRSNLAAANAAMLKGDAALAARHYAGMVRVDSGDMDAQYGFGQAYLDLRRYKEAAEAFEMVIARLPRGERSVVYADAAYAYLALGEDARAEAILTAGFGPEAAKRRLRQIREAIRKRSPLRLTPRDRLVNRTPQAAYQVAEARGGRTCNNQIS